MMPPVHRIIAYYHHTNRNRVTSTVRQSPEYDCLVRAVKVTPQKPRITNEKAKRS